MTGRLSKTALLPSRPGEFHPEHEGLLPANQLAQISGDDPPPSLQPHYRTFVAVGSEEAPIEGLASVRHSVGSRTGAPV